MNGGGAPGILQLSRRSAGWLVMWIASFHLEAILALPSGRTYCPIAISILRRILCRVGPVHFVNASSSQRRSTVMTGFSIVALMVWSGRAGVEFCAGSVVDLCNNIVVRVVQRGRRVLDEGNFSDQGGTLRGLRAVGGDVSCVVADWIS